MGQVDHERVVAAVREILIGIGEDPDREGLRETRGGSPGPMSRCSPGSAPSRRRR